MTTVGITGGAGYVGSKLAGLLLSKGCAVRVLDDFSLSSPQNLAGLDVDVIEGDVRDRGAVEGFVKGIDFVYDLAGVANIQDCQRRPQEGFSINAYARHVMMEALRDKPIRGYLFPSSVAAIYGDPEYVPVDEGHPVKPQNIYGVAKRASELFVMAYYHQLGMPLMVVRQSNVYGPSPGLKSDSVIHIFAKKALLGEPITIFGSGQQVRNFVFIDDLLRAYLSALESNGAAGEIINLAGEEISIADLAKLTAEVAFAYTGSTVEVQFAERRQEAEGKGLTVSVEKAHRLFGFRPEVSLRAGIGETVRFMLQGC